MNTWVGFGLSIVTVGILLAYAPFIGGWVIVLIALYAVLNSSYVTALQKGW